MCILTCPQCDKGIIHRVNGPGNCLLCSTCYSIFQQDSHDFFYDFRSGSPKQDRSLLIHEIGDTYANSILRRFVFNVVTNHLRKAVSLCNPNRILDVGCGNGAYAYVLDGLFLEYYGLEPSDIPRGRRLTSPTKSNVTLVHHDVDKPLPIKDTSVDLVSFISSYDHIPNIKAVLSDVWNKLKPGGFLLIAMTNYFFWAKRLVNFISRRKLFKQLREHHCTHSPYSLIQEVRSIEPKAEPFYIDADFLYIPNVPKYLSFLYFNYRLTAIQNVVIGFVVKTALGVKRSGSTMIIILQKES